jgi:ferritin-like metal-binding protein YciE
MNEVIPDLYVLRLIMEHIIFIQLWLSHRITVASISRSNRSVNNIRSHMASQLAEHATMYSASVVLEQYWIASYSAMKSWLTPD